METTGKINTVPARAPSLFTRVWEFMGFTRLGVIVFALFALLPWIPPFNREDLIRWQIGAALLGAQAIAFDFTAGYIGIVNFGFAAFVGLGGYVSALLAVRLGVSPWIGMFVGAFASGLLGLLTGALTLRLRGIFAAVMTWFVGLALLGLTRNLTDLTRGALGLNVPPLLDTDSNLPYYYVIYAMMLITLLTLRAITRSHIGLAFRAIGQNVDAARASGVNPTYYRVLNFTISCAFAGWLGSFYAHFYGILTPDVMATGKTVEVLADAYIGGRLSLWGGAVMAFPFVFFLEWLRTNLSQFAGLNLVIYGLSLILVMIYYPGGLSEAYHALARRLTRTQMDQGTPKVKSKEKP